MHIAEGVLSAPVLAAGGAAAAVLVGAGLRRLPDGKVLAAGFLAAVFFVASLVHVPVGAASAHLVMNGLLGMLLGPAACPAIFAALLLQAVLFQFGGLTVLGVNTATLGLGAVAAWLAWRGLRALLPARRGLAAWAAGFTGVAASSVLTAGALALSGEGFAAAAGALLVSNLPVMIAEGFVTLFAAGFLARMRPDLLP
ncbi:MAG: cobalt transporter CbiM [Duodenibacillus sp.]|nr:cobalt transporter CbiM [Duodenibacillus sp.]